MLIRSAVPLRVGAAIEEATGAVIGAGPLIGWLLGIVGELAGHLMQRCWTPATFTTLHEGVDALGRTLPLSAAVVAQRLGWIPPPPKGGYVPSRVVRLAQARVVPILKTLAHRDRMIPHLLAAVDEDGQLDRDRLDSDQLRYVNAAFVANLARQLRRSTGGAQITSITQIQYVPAVPRIARLGAVLAAPAAISTTPIATRSPGRTSPNVCCWSRPSSSARKANPNASPRSRTGRSPRPGTRPPRPDNSAGTNASATPPRYPAPSNRPILHAKRPCGTETSRSPRWEAPLHNPSQIPADTS